jgi:hypothetical protein
MKTILLTFFLMGGFCGVLYAQKQDDKSIEQHVLQIAANKMLLEYVKKGYRIVQDGLNVISSFKDGEYKLHDVFFKSLRSVNPAVSRYWKLAQITLLSGEITANFRRIEKQLGAFSTEEIHYVQQVIARVYSESTNVLEAVSQVSKPGELQMQDNERLARIDKLYLTMVDLYLISQNFCAGVSLLAAARLKEENDAKAVRSIYTISTDEK